MSEYLGWIKYFEDKERKQEVEKGNIMAMDESEIMSRFHV